MNRSTIRTQLIDHARSHLTTVDSHTAGEITRLVIDGLPKIPGKTMAEKRIFFKTHLDWIRLHLTREPRGHRDMFVAAVTTPVSPNAAFGLIYMDARRYPFLCGHATIGAVTTLIEAGLLSAQTPQTEIIVDTPSGPLITTAVVETGKVKTVTIQTVPSFVYATNQPVKLNRLGRIQIDLVCIGGFLALVTADQIKLALTPANSAALIALGMEIIAAANQQLHVGHPLRPEVHTVDGVEFYDPRDHKTQRGKNIVIYGEAHMDRSPCGTGTAAKMTLLHHYGQLALNQPFVNQGVLGTVFEGRLVKETRVGDKRAVVAEISGSAHITGLHEFILTSDDPFPEGFLL